MKSKTRQTSKNSPKKVEKKKALPEFYVDPSEVLPGALEGLRDVAQEISIGHKPSAALSPHDAELFRAFQSNLLSLISHELRTPLMGILNALSLLEERADVGMSPEELVRMARANAQRLHRTLVTLLDLASIESGSFHARMREVDLVRLVRSRVESNAALFRGRTVQVLVQEKKGPPLLGDPQKLTRALDLCVQVMIPRMDAKSDFKVGVSLSEVIFEFELAEDAQALWENAWAQALAGFEGGVASPASAFGGVLQSEQAFLTRMEEGLGSEFLLILEIMRLHRGKFEVAGRGRKVKATVSVPELSSEEGLRLVLNSRAYAVSSELGSVALVLIQIPASGDVNEFCDLLRKGLFRASDAVYPLPVRHQAALVLDDCKPEDAPHLIKRLQDSMGEKFSAGFAHCPADQQNPDGLLELAESRLAGALQGGGKL